MLVMPEIAQMKTEPWSHILFNVQYLTCHREPAFGSPLMAAGRNDPYVMRRRMPVLTDAVSSSGLLFPDDSVIVPI